MLSCIVRLKIADEGEAAALIFKTGLLAQTMRSSRPLELALDMAIGHVARLSM